MKIYKAGRTPKESEGARMGLVALLDQEGRKEGNHREEWKGDLEKST